MAITTNYPVLPLTIDELLTTTRAVRRRLDLDRPVERSVVEECLRLAFQAPTGSNAQNWGWVLIDDPDTRAKVGEIYNEGYRRQREIFPVDGPVQPVNLSGNHLHKKRVNPLVDVMGKVPVLVVPAFWSRFGGRDTTFQQASHWGSIVPAVWSFMLALRSRGLGSTWTTVALHCEDELSELLGIPPQFTPAGLFPVAYTVGVDFKPADRSFSDTRIFWNHWPDEQRSLNNAP
jgi:nitroreductase